MYRLRHRELVSVPFGSGAFKSIPLIVGTGPWKWLNTYAQLYEYVHFNSLSFDWDPTCPTTTQGALMMAVDHDPTDPVPTSIEELSLMQGCVNTAVYAPVHMNVTNLHDQHARYLTCGSGLPVDGSLRETSLGNLIIYPLVTLNGVGLLWVNYDVTLTVPQMIAASGASPACMFIPKDVGGANLKSMLANAVEIGDRIAEIIPDGSGQPVVRALADSVGLSLDGVFGSTAQDFIPANVPVPRVLSGLGTVSLSNDTMKTSGSGSYTAGEGWTWSGVRRGDTMSLGFPPSFNPYLRGMSMVVRALTASALQLSQSSDHVSDGSYTQDSPTRAVWLGSTAVLSGDDLLTCSTNNFVPKATGDYQLVLDMQTNDDLSTMDATDLPALQVVTATAAYDTSTFETYSSIEGGLVDSFTVRFATHQPSLHGITIDFLSSVVTSPSHVVLSVVQTA